jgi:acyl transferase domain-containing protein
LKKDQKIQADHPAASAPLAIIGIGCLFPKADDLGAYWANIKNGVDGITEVPPSHWRTEDYYAADPKTPDRTYGSRGGFISPVDFNPMEYNIPPNTLEAIDSSQLLGMVAADRALKDAGYGPDRDFDRERVSVILGVTGTLELTIPLGARLGHPIWRSALKDAGVDDAVAADVVERISDSYVSWQENSFPGLLGNVVAGRISKQFDLGGTNCVVDAACASSMSALHLAGMELSCGRSDMVVTGGVDTFNDIFMYMCFSKTPALSPTGNAKPFDANSDGTILGEGLGLLVLKRLADAERDNDRIYAVIKGIGSSSDGKGDAIYAPSAGGQKKALLNAYSQAGVTPDTIELVEAHGTGTRVGDAVEVSALREVYGEAKSGPWCALGSVKSQIGHTKAAAGVAGLIKAALALHHKVIPPTIKVEQPLAEVTRGATPFYLATEKRPWLPNHRHPRRAGVSAFGFGGSNFHCVLEEYRREKDAADWDGAVQILGFSGTDRRDLDAALESILADGPWQELRRIAAASRVKFDGSAPCRLILVVEQGRTNLAALLAGAQAMLRKSPGPAAWSTPDGAFFGSGVKKGLLGVLFPGQGAQYTGMLRDLACRFPQMLDALAEADLAFAADPGAARNRRLSDLVYPPSCFSPAETTDNESALRATDVAQPAIGAVSLGALRVLATFGVQPEAAAGHSYGELIALCAAGRFDANALHALSRLRGRLMADGNGDKGAMLAVSAPLAEVEEVIRKEKLELVLANKNAPGQAVLSGASAEIDRAEVIFGAAGLQCKRLQVAAAFHSPLVADASKPFLEALRDIPITGAQMPVFSNSSADEYPADMTEARELLAAHLAKPVEFVSEIENMHNAGVRTFIEVGPGARLTGLVKSILGVRDFDAFALDASTGKRSGIFDLARTLAQLAVLGHPVYLSAWDEAATSQEPAADKKKPLMTIPIGGANYVKPRPKKPPVTPMQRVAVELQAAPRVTASAPASGVAPVPAGAVPSGALAEALRMTGESMTALQQLQEQTAQLHRQFLQGQEAAGQTIQALLEQQQRLLFGGPGREAAAVLQHAAAGQPVSAAAPPAAVKPAETRRESVDICASTTPAPSAAMADRAARVLLEVVAEKTGYPVEMLELDMGLDADLGIDSIKRVEILSALQERLPDAPAVKPEHLGTLQTLRQIVTHLCAGAATAVAPTAVSVMSSAPASAGLGTDLAAEALLAVVAEKTGYPVEMLELDMGLDADLGIDSIKRVEILSALQERLPDAPAVKPEHLGTLQTLRQIVAHLCAGVATAAVPAAACGASSAAVSAGLGSDLAAAALLAVVAEKTGYPVEMLELDMGLDADLGIDSIKRVEILSALQERLPDAPSVKPEHLGTLQTLRQIVAHLCAGAPAATPAAECSGNCTASGKATAAAAGIGCEGVERSVLRAVPFAADESRQLVVIAAGAEICVVADGSPLAPAIVDRLRAQNFSARLLSPAEGGGLPTLPAEIGGLVLLSPSRGSDDRFLLDAFSLLQNAGPGLRSAARRGGALFVTVSRLDGCFGLAGRGVPHDPLSGGLAGLTKTAAHEWPEVSCKALDLGAGLDAQAAVAAVVSEMFLAGPVEVGLSARGLSTLELSPVPLAGTPPLAVAGGELFVITGGARGVTAEVAVSLAAAYRPTLLLLGRSAAPTAEPAWLAPLEGEATIKKALLEQAGKGSSPKQIEVHYRAVAANREMLRTLARIEATGATVVYHAVDIRDAAAVRAVLAEVRASFGPVRGLIHGAGVLADRLIVDKTAEQFEQVYATKVVGLRALLAALEADELRFMALFSSSTGRFGRSGQADYAVANEVLNKLALREAALRPACRVVSLNWGPWDGGMVTPALKKVFASEGVGIIGLTAGADYLLREIATPANGPVELVIIGSGANAAAAAPHQAAAPPEQPAHAADHQAFALELDVQRFPFLKSHVLDGKAVVPMAMIVEWLAHGALHGNPGLKFHGFNDLRILKGVVLANDAPFRLAVMAGKAWRKEAFQVVPVELCSSGSEGRPVVHARAEIVLAVRLPKGIRSISELELHPFPHRNGEQYSNGCLFHGPDLQGIEEVEGCSAEGIAAKVKAAPAPVSWISQPLRGRWLTDPLALDSAFQLMILWSFERHGAGSLPCFAGRYRQFQDAFPKDGSQVVIRITRDSATSAMAVMEFLDPHTGKLIARLEEYECIINESLKIKFARNMLPEPGKLQLGAA